MSHLPLRNADSKIEDGQNTVSAFKLLLDRYHAYLKEAGTQIRPYRSPDLPLFEALSIPNKQKAISEVKLVLEIFEEVKAEGKTLKDTPTLMWRSLRKLSLVPKSDIFQKIRDGDVVVIYATDHKQIFQNLRFLELVTITLEDVYCSEWFKYTKRPDWAQLALYEAGNSVFTGKVTETFDPQVPEHLAVEVTDAEIRLKINVRYMSPVTSDNQVAGVIVVLECAEVP